jgi:membrane associated rhomboid family serine protease
MEDAPYTEAICKNCGSEVSPYVTECPYCGQRVRRRAPDIGTHDPYEDEQPIPIRRGRRRGSSAVYPVPADTRPVVTIAMIGLALLATLVLSTGQVSPLDVGLVTGPADDEWWLVLTTPLVMQQNLGYLFITMLTLGIFGTQLERRYGAPVPLLVFVACGAAGAAAAMALESYPALGATGAALGMLVAWLVPDRVAAGRGDDRGTDMIGVVVLGIALALIPLADYFASFAAAAGGAAAGLVLGLLLALTRR